MRNQSIYSGGVDRKHHGANYEQTNGAAITMMMMNDNNDNSNNDLLPSLSSDDENDNRGGNEEQDDDDDEGIDVEFGGVLVRCCCWRLCDYVCVNLEWLG